MRSTVDLPDPDGPSSVVMPPSGASNDTSATAGVPRAVKRLVRLRTTRLMRGGGGGDQRDEEEEDDEPGTAWSWRANRLPPIRSASETTSPITSMPGDSAAPAGIS